MKIRHKLVILLVVLLVTLNSVIAFLIYKRGTPGIYQKSSGKGRVDCCGIRNHTELPCFLPESIKIGITEQTKYFIPAVSGHAIGVKFAEKQVILLSKQV